MSARERNSGGGGAPPPWGVGEAVRAGGEGGAGDALLLQSSPFLRQGVTTPRIMGDVVIALVPVVAVAVWAFGLSAILVLAAATAGAVGTEWLLPPAGTRRGESLANGSAVLTGILLGLTLPPGIALWMAALGGAVGIGLGKLVWGGLGQNLFNPALVGRAFLQAAFPVAITTWSPPAGPLALRPTNLAAPFLQPSAGAAADAVTTATPLNLMKFEHRATELPDLFLGNVAGSLGETSALAVLLGLAWLLLRRACDWRIPVAIVATVAALSGLLWAVAPDRHPSPGFMVLSGGLLFGAVYMATDPVTSPLAPRGVWLFGFGIGALVVLIRLWGGLPEGVMYAILLMNAAAPLIERATQPKAFGRGRAA
ncbi:MAG: RnfABCDGE type electron transport complex subunit D [Thermoanaerobaculia bacterium]